MKGRARSAELVKSEEMTSVNSFRGKENADKKNKHTHETDRTRKRSSKERGKDEKEVEREESRANPSSREEVGGTEGEENLHRSTNKLGEERLNHARPVGAENCCSRSVLPDCTKVRMSVLELLRLESVMRASR